MLINSDINIGIYIAIEVILGLSIITVIVLSSVGYSSLQYSMRAVNDIQENWMKSPIMDIIEGVGSCSNGYSPLIEDKWKGTVSGCDCVGRYSYRIKISRRNRLNRDYCSFNESLGGCSNVGPVSPIDYNVYKGKTICVKKSSVKFDDLFINAASGKKSCKSTMKQCGTLDSIGNLLCVDKSSHCPVNKVIIQKNNLPEPTKSIASMIKISRFSRLVPKSPRLLLTTQ